MEKSLNVIFKNFVDNSTNKCEFIIKEKNINNLGQDTEEMVFLTKDNVFKLDNKIIEDCKDFFCDIKEENNNKILNQNCDGVLINETKKELIFVELKTKLGSEKFIKAIKQIEDSIIKTIMYLNLIEAFDVNEYKIKSFIVFKKQDQFEATFISKIASKYPKYSSIITNKSVNMNMYNSYKDVPLKKYDKYSVNPIILQSNKGRYNLDENTLYDIT